MTSPFDGRMVFVLGPVRSGTSWLAELFMAHPEFAGVQAESLVFTSLMDFWDSAHRSDDEGVASLMELPEFVAVLRRYCDRVFSAARDRHRPGAAWFVEKSPTHSLTVPLMAATHPDAWYVHIVRDGRDVVRSHLQSPFGPGGAAEAAAVWAGNVRAVRNHAWRLPRFREIRYESMLEDPVAMMTSLFQWMGAPVDDEVEAAVRERAPKEVVRYDSTEAVGSGKWTSMDPADLAAIDEVAHDVLAELGYLGPPLRSEAPPE